MPFDKKLTKFYDHPIEEAISLTTLQISLRKHYDAYRVGELSEQEYICKIRPIDKQIDQVEMACLITLKKRR